MFVDMLEVLANSKSYQHRIIGEGIYSAYIVADGTFALALRALSNRQLLALVSTLKNRKYSTQYDVRQAVRAMRDQYVSE